MDKIRDPKTFYFHFDLPKDVKENWIYHKSNESLAEIK